MSGISLITQLRTKKKRLKVPSQSGNIYILISRDLDVLYRTNLIDSQTMVFKDGMKEWLQMYKIETLKTTLIDANNEAIQVQ